MEKVNSLILPKNIKERLDEEQKNYILKEKIKLIKEEISDNDLKTDEIDYLKEQIDACTFPKNIKERLDEELKRYTRTPETSPEISIIRNYIDWLINMPWNKVTKDNQDIESIKKELDNTHFGLENIKRDKTG